MEDPPPQMRAFMGIFKRPREYEEYAGIRNI
jgi:hypothetical protein